MGILDNFIKASKDVVVKAKNAINESQELNKNEITLYLYNDKSYVYMQVDRNEAIEDEMISEAEILNYCYLLLK